MSEPAPRSHEVQPLPAARPAEGRRWLRGVPPTLAVLTTLTLLVTGGLVWPQSPYPLERLSDLFRPEFLLTGVPYALGVLAVLAAHEGGHWLACRAHGIPVSSPLLLPGVPPLGTFGAILRIRGTIPDRRALFDVAAAGPLAGFAVALPMLGWGFARAVPVPADAAGGGLTLGAPLLLLVLQRLTGSPEGAVAVGPVFVAGWFGMLLTSLNLFPVGQLDGGHVVYAVSPRLHRRAAWLTIAALILFVAGVLAFVGEPSPYMIWAVLMVLLRGRHPRLADEDELLGPGRRALAVVLLALFVLCFIPVPLSVG